MITTQARAAKAPPPVSPKPAEKSIVELIADKIIDLNRIDEGVSAQDLEPFFARAIIDKHGPEAANLARSLANRSLA